MSMSPVKLANLKAVCVLGTNSHTQTGLAHNARQFAVFDAACPTLSLSTKAVDEGDRTLEFLLAVVTLLLKRGLLFFRNAELILPLLKLRLDLIQLVLLHLQRHQLGIQDLLSRFHSPLLGGDNASYFVVLLLY